ncbi:MAG: TRAP transporter substrate-binding protein [Desulfobacteraceae bacterium]|uniref:TRAP transporter substrate-binding protein n=1 Tax=Candidatus Desulfacyla euxinica TaxID=2841693 RepID=A0A8J6N1N7_9DELT|nr:TRAP transporter substrate-binding protein [Candidatus Desulfacyla euxinica]MBL6977641.1 TRAP transporter substrate-binding protein [Desulfobacteraceae bacterium]
MQKKWMPVLMVLLFAVTLMVGLITLPAETLAKDKPIIVKIPTLMPKSPPSRAPTSRMLAFFAKQLEANSDGRFKVKIYWGGSLYRDDATCYAALKDNIVQMAIPAGARMAGEMPEVILYSLPFVFEDMEHFRRFAYGPKGFKPVGGPGSKLYEQLFEKNGYKFITFLSTSFQNYVSSKGFLAKPEDFKGVKFRIRQSKLAAEITEAFGGSAMAIPFMEAYTALSLKTVDASECPLYLIFALKWHETGDYITISRHSLLSGTMIANLDWYNGLPEDLKKILNETVEESVEFLFKASTSMEQMMPWIMMSQKPSLQFKWLSQKERGKLKEQVKPLLDKYKKTIPKEYWDAVETTRSK